MGFAHGFIINQRGNFSGILNFIEVLGGFTAAYI